MKKTDQYQTTSTACERMTTNTNTRIQIWIMQHWIYIYNYIYIYIPCSWGPFPPSTRLNFDFARCLKGFLKNTWLRVIPPFVIASDISSGHVYAICFLTFYSGILSDILFWRSILAFYLESSLTSYLASFLASILTFSDMGTRSGSAHWDLLLTVQFRQCPLRSGDWGLAVPTLRSGAQCPLRSWARRWARRTEEGGSNSDKIPSPHRWE